MITISSPTHTAYRCTYNNVSLLHSPMKRIAYNVEVPATKHTANLDVVEVDSGVMPVPSRVSLPPPLDMLPIELLILIFSFCVADDPDVASVLSTVSCQWRAIMTDLPSLWHHLQLSDAKFDPRRLQEKSALWLSRSATLPLDIALDTRRHDSVLPMLSYALAGVSRWRNVSFLQSRMRFLTTTDRASPCLESLLITLTPRKPLDSDAQGDVSLPDSPLSWRGGRNVFQTKNFQAADKERLKEIYVLGVRCLPPPEQVAPFATVTSLALMNGSPECDFPMHQAVPFLSAFPALESLELSNFSEHFLLHDPEYRPDCHSLAPAVLPNLRRLCVRGICSSRCILSHLSAPQLQVLSLVHINSADVYNFPVQSEPGDSDDEAHDFSRSPWTDHATGMGLRRFFGHKPPPIRELVMDYADLRTKDFKWLFARLGHLETFRIVASDMSDNVLRALQVGGSVDGGAAPLREPPLPRLTCLEFSKCQNLTGDAVVRTIASRLRAAECGQVAAFKELIISECLQVTEDHHQELQAIFPSGARLHYAPGFNE
ncbi:hypothetical protein M0805_007498 [Coniferiporia weirii]|nr:hypothetical protein M0805_007498 [Coniferiporia weirii]